MTEHKMTQKRPYQNRGQRRKPQGRPLNGWLNFYKPSGMTSAQAVAMVKKHFNAQKVGHGGTLDPLADGVLPLAFGKATKTMQFCLEADKAYQFTIQFGAATTTDDSEGEVVKTSDIRPTKQDVELAIQTFLGAIEQLPPLFSALKVNGKRAYDLARAGEEFELATRPVMIKDYVLDTVTENKSGLVETATCSVLVSKGTYVRSLARDLGEKLGCFGHIIQLKRTKAGVFELFDAVTQENLDNIPKTDDGAPMLLPVGAVLDDILGFEPTSVEQLHLKEGRSFKRSDLNAGVYKAMKSNGFILGVVSVSQDGLVEVVRNF